MKMKELSTILDEMITAGNAMIEAANALKAYFSENDKAKEAPAPVVDAPTLTKEDVRKLLVEKSNADGGEYKPAVKALVQKYSTTGYLSDIASKDYASLVAELEVLGNG